VIAEGSPGELKSRVGLDRIEVHTRDMDSAQLAASVVAGLGVGQPQLDLATRKASVPSADGPSVLPTATARLLEAGVATEDLTLRRPTLDEVFLAITGHHAQNNRQLEGTSR
jgi:ABC-2 type transport system ATP-binding protein